MPCKREFIARAPSVMPESNIELRHCPLLRHAMSHALSPTLTGLPLTGLLGVLVVFVISSKAHELVSNRHSVSESGLAVTPKNISIIHHAVQDCPLIEPLIPDGLKVIRLLTARRLFPGGERFRFVLENGRGFKLGLLRESVLW